MAGSKLYKEKIIDHYKNPRNFEAMEDAEMKARVSNSVCGDEVTMYLRVDDGEVIDISFEGSGCAISIAGASMLTEKLVGKTVGEIAELDDDFVLKLLGIEKKSPRLKCAVLGLEAARRAVTGEASDECDFC